MSRAGKPLRDGVALAGAARAYLQRHGSKDPREVWAYAHRWDRAAWKAIADRVASGYTPTTTEIRKAIAILDEECYVRCLVP